jgi:hypothetical protein
MRRCSDVIEENEIDKDGPISQLVISQVDTFSLNELNNFSGLSRRGGRHLRQIEELRCTTDGQYAIIRCSDNAVVIYR